MPVRWCRRPYRAPLVRRSGGVQGGTVGEAGRGVVCAWATTAGSIRRGRMSPFPAGWSGMRSSYAAKLSTASASPDRQPFAWYPPVAGVGYPEGAAGCQPVTGSGFSASAWPSESSPDTGPGSSAAARRARRAPESYGPPARSPIARRVTPGPRSRSPHRRPLPPPRSDPAWPQGTGALSKGSGGVHVTPDPFHRALRCCGGSEGRGSNRTPC